MLLVRPGQIFTTRRAAQLPETPLGDTRLRATGLRARKMINIGGRPVIVSNLQPASPHDRADTIKMALAFAAIYIVWGSTYLAIRYAVATIPPLVTAGIRHAIAGGLRGITGFQDAFWARSSF